jgi:hypothetical protein
MAFENEISAQIAKLREQIAAEKNGQAREERSRPDRGEGAPAGIE